jgi:predicted transcriptional regulator
MTRHRLNPVRLRAEILKRGLDGQTFAAEAGISAATLSHVVGGRSANPRTLTAIVRALSRIPVVDGIDDLLEEMPVSAEGPLAPHASLIQADAASRRR